MLDVAIGMEIVDKRGTFIMYEGSRIGQGRENAKTFLNEHLDVAAKIEKQVRESIATGAANKVAQKTKPEAGEEDDDEEPEE
jgi:recombination protein RecA